MIISLSSLNYEFSYVTYVTAILLLPTNNRKQIHKFQPHFLKVRADKFCEAVTLFLLLFDITGLHFF